MLFFDTIELADAKPRRTEGGYLVVPLAKFARTGIQVYAGRELKRPDLAQVRMYRPPEEVFSDKAMASFAHRPITDDHPPVNVTAKNWKQFARGQAGGDVVRDGEYISVPLAVMDGEMAEKIEAGKVELSAGYSGRIEWTAGLTDGGEPFDCVLREPRGNHIAVVRRGRAGPECRIADDLPADLQDKEPTMADIRTMVFDGLTISVTDQAAQAIDKLQGQIAAKAAEVAGLQDAHRSELTRLQGALDAAKAEHQASLGLKDAEIANLKTQVLDGPALDAAVQKRAALMQTVRAVLGDAYQATGKSDAQIKRDAVAKHFGDRLPVADKEDAYVSAVFDSIVVQTPSASQGRSGATDTFRRQLSRGDVAPTGEIRDGAAERDTAHREYLESLQNRWRTPESADSMDARR